jgi:DNA modification methylase
MIDTCYVGDVRDGLRAFIAAGIRAQTCITSPPYWGLRDYGVPGQLGLEATPGEYVERMVEVFRLVRDVLAGDGTLWLNLGDSYAGSRCGGDTGQSGLEGSRKAMEASKDARRAMTRSRRRDDEPIPRSDVAINGLKPKDLVGMPWRVAFALQADGWYLRSDIIWHKPNPMPESVNDRPTKAHEYLFLLAKSERYFYDADAIKEPACENTHDRTRKERASPDHKSAPDARRNGTRPHKPVAGWANGAGISHDAIDHAQEQAGRDGKLLRKAGVNPKAQASSPGAKQNASFASAVSGIVSTRNKRSVWTIATEPYSEAHFATFPTALVEPCILAGSRPGDIVLDPFMGSGTTAMVAQSLGRRWIGCELNGAYVEMQRQRAAQFGMELVA